MKEILIKTLKAYQSIVNRSKRFKNPINFYKLLENEYLYKGICYFILCKYSENKMEEFMDILVKHSRIPRNRIRMEFYCNPPYYYQNSIKDCVEKALKPRIELLTKMINDYESIN